MHTVRNLLTGDTFDLLASTGAWTIAGGGGAGHTITTSRELIKFADVGAMYVNPASNSLIYLTSPVVPVGDDWGWNGRGFAWFYSTDPITITVDVIATTSTVETVSTVVSIKENTWTLVSGAGPYLLQGSTLQMQFTITGHVNATQIYVQHPVLIVPDAIARNIYAAEVWQRLPEYMREADEFQTDPNFPLLRFIDAITCESNEIYALWDTYRYIPPEEGGLVEATSLLEPEVADLQMLRWWAQILHVDLYNPSSGTTSWHNLETQLNPGGDPEWQYWETVPDTVDAGTDVSWDEIEDFAPEVAGLLDLLRWQIRTAYFGLRGGTKEAVVESAKKALSGTQTVEYTINYTGDPWKIRIRTLVAETPDVDGVGQTSQTVVDLISRAVPAGFEIVHLTM